MGDVGLSSDMAESLKVGRRTCAMYLVAKGKQSAKMVELDGRQGGFCRGE